jgi:aminoglycoside 6'-N-acetyltransferase
MIEDGDLLIRPMRDDLSDYQMMARWLSDPRVLEFYDGRDQALTLNGTLNGVREKYSPRILNAEGVTPCSLIYQGAPAGYLQFYPTEEGVFGIDQFIGEPELWNRGVGTRAVSLMVHYLFQVHGARKVTVDPHADNARAIRCYEKCGFRKARLLPQHELHEGSYRDCWLLEISYPGS